MFRGFAQQNRPRNFAPNAKFRNQAIAFVSAGSNTPVEVHSETQIVEATMVDTGGDADERSEDDEEEDEEEEAEAEVTPPETHHHASGDGVSGIDDGIQTNIVRDGATMQFAEMNLDRKAANSPVPSESSDEEVVFLGRNAKPKSVQPPAPEQPHVTDALLEALEAPLRQPSPSPSPTRQASAPVDPKPSYTPQASSSSSAARGWAARSSKWAAQEIPADSWTPAPAYPYWKKGKPRPDLDPSPVERLQIENTAPRQSKVMFAEPAESERAAEETIASLQEDWRQVLRDKNPVTTSAESDSIGSKAKSPGRRGKRGRRKDNRFLRAVLVSDDEDETEAAYDDYMANLAAQLDGPPMSENGPEAGPSLVVNGKAVKEDEVLNEDSQMSVDDKNGDDDDDSDASYDGPIGQDLSDLSDDQALNASDLDSSDLEDEIIYTEQEQWEDEEDLRQRRMDRMTDEQIARLFAKQSELGIDGDELLIDDGAFEENVEGVGDLNEARAGLTAITNSAFGRSVNKHGMRRRKDNGVSFPDASALADTVEQYGENGFDIMDLDRPSLRSTKKGRKGKLPPELEALSDDELKESMKETWDNDRTKKAQRKAERELLRAEGLLGVKNGKKVDLGQKYDQGMTMKQIIYEIRTFLQNDEMESRAFPPMDKRDRKALHELANVLNLKSKSIGTGHSRFPILYKTSQTPEYIDDDMFARLISKGGKRGFLKNAKAPKGGPGKKGAAGGKVRAFGGGASMAAASLRHGEIVGAGAAEIGKENFGHKLMEKMGWSKGMALGKDGEGIITPVEQVMRAGKAGLG